MTGELVITVQKATSTHSDSQTSALIKSSTMLAKVPVNKKLAEQPSNPLLASNKKNTKLEAGNVSVVDYRNIIKNNEKKQLAESGLKKRAGMMVGGIVELQGAIKPLDEDESFIDDPDVPPLC